MNWDQIQVNWNQFRGRIVQRFSATDNYGRRLELSSPEISRGGESDAQRTDFIPEGRARQSEFSLHIGC